MPRDGAGPDFIEALARGLDVITAFGAARPAMTLAEVASATGLARPTVRRILLTLAELGYVRTVERGYTLTPRVLDLGVSYVDALGCGTSRARTSSGWSRAPASRARSPSSTAPTSSTSRGSPCRRSCR
jgi:DNA-binding transcriptional ArsR family regulator